MSVIDQMREAESVMAQAAREIERLRAENNRLRDALDECRDFFEPRADAEYFTDRPEPVGNEEMRMLALIDRALGRIP